MRQGQETTAGGESMGLECQSQATSWHSAPASTESAGGTCVLLLIILMEDDGLGKWVVMGGGGGGVGGANRAAL